MKNKNILWRKIFIVSICIVGLVLYVITKLGWALLVHGCLHEMWVRVKMLWLS